MRNIISNQLNSDFIDGLYSEVQNKSYNGEEVIGCCPFHEDKTPSFSFNPNKNGVYHCHSGKCGVSGNVLTYIKEVKGEDDPIQFLKENYNVTYYEDNVIEKKPKVIEKKKISYDVIEQAHINLIKNKDKLNYLFTLGFSKDVIKKYDIGLDKGWYWFPIIDSVGDYVNIRKYNPNATPKIMSYGEGYGNDRLYPYTSLTHDEIYVFEGEKDTLLALSLGIPAITNTCGSAAFKNEFGMLFQNKTVYICMDIDDAGKSGAKKRYDIINKYAEKTIIVELDLDIAKYPHGDFSDFIKKENKTLKEFYDICKKTTKKEKLNLDEYGWALKFIEEKNLIHIDQQSTYEYCEKGFWKIISELKLKQQIQQLLLKYDNRPKNSLIKQIAEALITYIRLDYDDLNLYRNSINFINGVLDLDKYTLLPHDKQYFITQQLNHKFDVELLNQENIDMPVWGKFLDEVFEGDQQRIDLIQEIFGYCLTTDTRYEKAFIFKGEGRNGKSTIIKTLENIVGKSNVSNVTFNDLTKPFLRATLHGKLLNTAGEMDFNNTTSSEFFKSIVSSDSILIENKHEKPFMFKPFCKLLFATNGLPKLKDRTFGYFRKLLIIPFDVTIDESKIDLDLEEKIQHEYPQIVAWALQGLKRLKQNKKFTHSDKTIQTLNQYKYDNNTLMQFVDECCEIEEFSQVTKKDFVRKYENYCKSNNVRAFGTIMITKELEKNYNVIQKQSYERHYVGIKFVDDQKPNKSLEIYMD